jgi:hypothetical protein
MCTGFRRRSLKKTDYMTDLGVNGKNIRYIYYLQLGCHPVAAVQYTFTHKQYTEQHN